MDLLTLEGATIVGVTVGERSFQRIGPPTDARIPMYAHWTFVELGLPICMDTYALSKRASRPSCLHPSPPKKTLHW